MPSIATSRLPAPTIKVWLGLLLLSFGLSAFGHDDEGRLTVSGHGEVQIVPDQADLQLALSQRGQDIAAMRQAIDEGVSQVLKSLRALGLPERDLAATRINIQPVYRYDPKLQQRMEDGYEITRSIAVTVRDLALLEPVITRATDLGVNHISSPQLSSSNHEVSYREALTSAIEQATARAQVLATAAGTEVDGVESIHAQDSPSYPRPVARMAMAADSEGSSYQPGEMTVSATVTMIFSLKD